MAIYKPTNCHPFADAIDITKTLLTIEPQGDGTWDWNQPEPVYFTCKLETNNLPVIGYRIRIHINGEVAFEGKKISPINELTKFKDDPTINSGVNGTYLAIPAFRYGSWEEKIPSLSYNTVYVVGESQSTDDGTDAFKADYLIAVKKPGSDDSMTGSDSFSSWAQRGDHFYCDGWDGTLNGGHLVTKDDVVLIATNLETYGLYICHLSEDGKSLKSEAVRSVYSSNLHRSLAYIAKGDYSGLYMYTYDNSSVILTPDIDWSVMFCGVEGDPSSPDVNSSAFSGFGDSQMSWDIDLLQGPEDYLDLTAQEEPDFFINGVDDISFSYYDMKIASGTILGSCAKRLHLSSITQIGGDYLLPGENKRDPVVLQGTYCELYYASTGGSNPGEYVASHKMVPSFPISSFDSSLGLVYPKEYSMSEGGLTQSALETFLASIPQGASIPNGVFARFFKYSSNSSDVLSNEKVRAAYWDLNDSETDPRIFLKPRAVVDGIELAVGDRILWNTTYEQGCYNGIWVVQGATEEPTRPADGNEYSDYIGKVTLISEGNVHAATVVESNAEAGANVDLGQMPIFFREQYPISLFNIEPTGHLDSTGEGVVSEILTNGTMESYMPLRERGGFDLRPLPVVYPNGKVLLTSRRNYDGSNIPIAGTYYVELSNGYIQCSDVQGTGYNISYAYYGPAFIDAGVTSPQGFIEKQEMYGELYYRNASSYPYDYRIATVYTAGLTYYYKTYQTNTVYIKGETIDLALNYGMTFQAESGNNSGRLFVCSFDAYSGRPVRTYLLSYSAQTGARVLFNETTCTYVSPTSQKVSDMILSLKNGALTTINSTQTKNFRINQSETDKKFNRVTHAALASPLPAAPDAAATPPTPYKYDILSCFRTSDQNAFTSVPPLTPHIEPSDQNGLLEGGYSVFADASCFQGEGKAWNSARLILPGVSLEDSQDTFWFSSKGLDAEFAGLEPGNSYEAILYAKDSDGRTTSERRGIYVPPDTDEYIQMSRLYEKPVMNIRSTGSYYIILRFYADQYSLDASNMDEYFQTIALSSNGSGGVGTYDTSSPNAWSIDTVDGKEILQLKLYAATASTITTGTMDIYASMDSPVGKIFFYMSEDIAVRSGPTYSYILRFSSISSPATPQVFTGVFPGELTAESDCSTQSVVLTYKPAGGYDSWPDGLPLDQDGTYDVFRREYSDFKKSASCGYGNPLSPVETETWYGEWEPAILHTDNAVMRDFNVKQGHSYQYAIFPKRRSSLKIEKEFLDSEGNVGATRIEPEPDDSYTNVYIGFDNSLLGIPENAPSFWFYLSGFDANGTDVLSEADSLISYYGEIAETGIKNGYITIEGLGDENGEFAYPVTIDIKLSYLGMTLKARVIFTSDTEYTVEPLDGSYGWRRRLLANGGEPVYVQWDAWSLVELEEADPDDLVDDPLIRHPYVRKAYKADLDKIWLFRYDAEPGSQSINLTKGEISTLGRYARFSSGNLNAESGEMSAWLGSEVVPGTRLGYIERRRKTIWAPMATNEAAARLAEFRAMVASDKPKLLRDRKGRSWIVQVSGGSSSTQDNFVGTPTKISFSWKEIAASGPYVVIIGEGDELPPIDEESEWKPNIVFSASH